MKKLEIGRIVHGRVRVSSVSSPSGTLVISLPFTRANPGEDSLYRWIMCCSKWIG